MYAIELKDIVKDYSQCGQPAVDGLNLRVGHGEIVTLLGPSGCGKTTTLRLIAGFERADSGSISLDGVVVSDSRRFVTPDKRGIGMVFQDYALFPHLTVAQNVGFGCRAQERQQRTKEMLELVGLPGMGDRYPHQLSGGQQQRVALARALAPRPVVVLLDEPFSNLDADLRGQMRSEVKRILNLAGATAILVTHDQKDALAISDRIVVMCHGSVQQEGTPREIYQFPENRFVASFVGESNILCGKMGESGDTVHTLLGEVPCSHTHGKSPGSHVCVSIRPESLEQDPQGQVEGVIRQFHYSGQSIDARIETLGEFPQELTVHIHPEHVPTLGDTMRFRILPEFVAVIRADETVLDLGTR